MRAAFRCFSKLSKPIPKKGSTEHREIQMRLAERKEKFIPKPPVEEESKEIMPKVFKYGLIGATIPISVGVSLLFVYDNSMIEYYYSLAFTGTWIATSTLLLKGADIGLEGYWYKRPFYNLIKNKILTGRKRVFGSLLGLPMSYICIKSCLNYNWSGLAFFFVYQQLMILLSIYSSQEGLVPGWYSTGYWMYVGFSQIALVMIIYSLISQKDHAHKQEEEEKRKEG